MSVDELVSHRSGSYSKAAISLYFLTSGQGSLIGLDSASCGRAFYVRKSDRPSARPSLSLVGAAASV